eukprot:scaffold249404_cov22-Tisochrysis_lutea.AAC.2
MQRLKQVQRLRLSGVVQKLEHCQRLQVCRDQAAAAAAVVAAQIACICTQPVINRVWQGGLLSQSYAVCRCKQTATTNFIQCGIYRKLHG